MILDDSAYQQGIPPKKILGPPNPPNILQRCLGALATAGDPRKNQLGGCRGAGPKSTVGILVEKRGFEHRCENEIGILPSSIGILAMKHGD